MEHDQLQYQGQSEQQESRSSGDLEEGEGGGGFPRGDPIKRKGKTRLLLYRTLLLSMSMRKVRTPSQQGPKGPNGPRIAPQCSPVS